MKDFKINFNSKKVYIFEKVKLESSYLMAKATGSELGGPQHQQRQDSPMADEMFDGQVSYTHVLN